MSASKEKKTRQEQTASGWTDPKTAREAKQRQEERKSSILYATIAVVFVVVAIVSLTWKSGVLQRQANAATIHGESYTASEVQYYYQTAYQGFVNSYYSYLSYFGLDTSKSLKDQTCNMTADGGSWYDYFLDQALTQMANIQALCDAAATDGVQWDDEMQAEYDAAMESLSASVASYNQSQGTNLNTKAYLNLIFGSLMTQKVYEEQLKQTILAQTYSNRYVESLEYSTSDLSAAYEADTKSFDRVDYESVRISGAAAPTTDAEGNSVEATDDEKAAALKDAKALAERIYASYKDGEKLEALAEDEDSATYTDGVEGSYSDSKLMNWLFDSARKAGDSAVVSDEDNSAYYVVVFGERYRYEYNTVNVRHILVSAAEGDIAEGEDGYEEQQKQLAADAKAKADELLAQWKAGDATEDSFAQLAQENSEDTSAADGGLISQISKNVNIAEEFKDWCFDASRKTGDTGVVESDYGYHVMFFVGEDLPYWQVQATSALQSEDYSAWYEAKTEGYTAEQNSSGMKHVG